MNRKEDTVAYSVTMRTIQSDRPVIANARPPNVLSR